MKISEAFNEYRRLEVRAKGYSYNTDQSYGNAGNKTIQYFGDIKIRRLTADDISSFYLALVTPNSAFLKTISKNTARSYICKLRMVIKFCRKHGEKTVNPDEIILPRGEKQYARFVDSDEYKTFMDEIGRPHRGYSNLNRERNVLICKMLFYTGLRIGELCALNRDTIRNRQFTVVGKSKDPRPCFITKEIEQDIKRYLSHRADDNPALFISNETGERVTPNTVQRVFRRVAKETKLAKVTPHTMRHSFATRMLEDGVDIRYVAAFLGHQSLDTTKRYTHVRDFKMRQIYTNIMERSC